MDALAKQWVDRTFWVGCLYYVVGQNTDTSQWEILVLRLASFLAVCHHKEGYIE